MPLPSPAKAASSLRGRVALVYTALVAGNLGAWAWALILYRDHPVLIGAAVLSYGLGLRHALDADHIAAIDNVTRKLMHEGQRPVGVGLFFSLGHSTVVLLATLGVALSATMFQPQFTALQAVGGVFGPLVSSLFLLVIAGMNVLVFLSVIRAFRHVHGGDADRDGRLENFVGGSGFLTRVLNPAIRRLNRSAMMYPLGFLFGLGFDTATEIALLGISAAQAASGLPVWSILVFPALFTAAMTLVDTTDSLFMLGAYGWAFSRPIRKLYYNLTVTAVSAIAAFAIGGVQLARLANEHLWLPGGQAGEFLGAHSDAVGAGMVALFALCWMASALLHRSRVASDFERKAGDSMPALMRLRAPTVSNKELTIR